VAVAEAGIRQASGSRAAALEGATTAQIGAAEARLAAAQALFLIAQRQFEPLAQNTDADEAQREQARLQLVAAQSNINAAQAVLDELRAGPIAAEQTAANSAVLAASGQRDAAEAQLALLQAGAREEQIAVAAAAVAEAQNRVLEAELRIVQVETAVVRAQSAIVEAELALATAQTALERRTLTAPFAGTVAAIPVKVGAIVTPGASALVLADFSRWQIETTDLSEIGVVNIANGFTADVTIDAFPGETLQGVIVDIASNSELVRGDVTYRVTLDLQENVTLPLRWGMTTFVSIDTRP
jgi:multidrug resistance efflux pump